MSWPVVALILGLATIFVALLTVTLIAQTKQKQTETLAQTVAAMHATQQAGEAIKRAGSTILMGKDN